MLVQVLTDVIMLFPLSLHASRLFLQGGETCIHTSTCSHACFSTLCICFRQKADVLKRNSSINQNGVVLEKLAIRLGLEDPVKREKRLRAAERAEDQQKQDDEKAMIWELLAKGKSAQQVSKDLNLELRKCIDQKDRSVSIRAFSLCLGQKNMIKSSLGRR